MATVVRAGKSAPASSLAALNLMAIAACVGGLLLFDLNNQDSSPADRVWWVLAVVAAGQLGGLLIVRSRSVESRRRGSRREVTRTGSNTSSTAAGNTTFSWFSLRNDVLAVLVTVATFHGVIILLGAYVIDHTEQTLALSCLLTLFTVVNLVSVKPHWTVYAKSLGQSTHPLQTMMAGISADRQQDRALLLDRILLSKPFQMADPTENFLISTCYATLVGAWFGTFPIKLDWNEPWQRFPVTNFVGAMLANALCHLTHLIYLCLQLTVFRHSY